MKKLFIVLLCSLAIIGLALTDEIHKNCYDSVALVQAVDKSANGTAVIVQSKKIDSDLYMNTVFSAEHIFAKPMCLVPLIRDEGFVETEESLALQIIYKNSDTDLALASFLSAREFPVADLDFKTVPKMRDKVFLIGCGLGQPMRYSEGLVTGLGPNKKKYENIQTSIYTVPGDSGSPVYLNQKVIAITSSIRSFQSDGHVMAANEIALCKPIKLYENVLYTEKYNFILDQKKPLPKIMIDWLWLLDSGIKFN